MIIIKVLIVGYELGLLSGKINKDQNDTDIRPLHSRNHTIEVRRQKTFQYSQGKLNKSTWPIRALSAAVAPRIIKMI